MSDKIELNCFPSTTVEALAMLYVQNQDLSGKTPEDLYAMYNQARFEIGEANRKFNREKWLD